VSENKHFRQAWITKVYAATVELFHETRKTPEEAETPLADLARKCANTTFAEASPLIVGDKEQTAREFMRYCRKNIGQEILKAIQERATEDVNRKEALAS
jgi:hypothetical protein